MKKYFYLLSFSLFVSVGIKAQTYGWSELGGQDSLHANDGINTIFADMAGNIYAGGPFTDNPEIHVGYIYVAKYNNVRWSDLGGQGGLEAYTEIESLCSDRSGNIYAAGAFVNDSGKCYVARFNGTSWSELGGLNALAANSWIYSICTDTAGNLYAAGIFTNSLNSFYVAKYDGTSWREVGGLNALHANDGIMSICTDAAGNIYAAGNFQNDSGLFYVAKFDGVSWSEVGGGINYHAVTGSGISSICMDPSGNIYLAGGLQNDSGNTFVAKYDGLAWRELGGFNSLHGNGIINSLCTDLWGNIYAGGWFRNDSLNEYVAVYNGTNWSELGGLNSLHANYTIRTVCSDYAGNIYAAGYFSNGLTSTEGYFYVAQYHPFCHPTGTTITDSICHGAGIKFNGHNLTHAGIYTDTLQSFAGCDSVVKLVLSVDSLSVPIVSFSNDTLHTQIFASYQWLLNDLAIANATAQNTRIIQNGNYSVIVTNSMGCSDTSAALNVTGLGVNEITGSYGVKLYPNPNTGNFNVAFTDGVAREIEITNVIGQIVIPATKIEIQMNFNLQDIAAGIYFLRICNDGTARSLRFCVAR